MKTITNNPQLQNIRLYSILNDAIDFIDSTMDQDGNVDPADIKARYNSNCDQVANPDQYSLAATVAIGAITEQEGSNIQGPAAIQNLFDLLYSLDPQTGQIK